eukprot:108300-Amphidinium_carterae.1
MVTSQRATVARQCINSSSSTPLDVVEAASLPKTLQAARDQPPQARQKSVEMASRASPHDLAYHCWSHQWITRGPGWLSTSSAGLVTHTVDRLLKMIAKPTRNNGCLSIHKYVGTFWKRRSHRTHCRSSNVSRTFKCRVSATLGPALGTRSCKNYRLVGRVAATQGPQKASVLIQDEIQGTGQAEQKCGGGRREHAIRDTIMQRLQVAASWVVFEGRVFVPPMLEKREHVMSESISTPF